MRPPNTTNLRVVERDAAWRPEQTRELTPLLDRETREDVFVCAGRGTMFASNVQFRSDTGWPSLPGQTAKLAPSERGHPFHVIPRTGLRTARRGANLGHVFPDGPRATTGLRCGSNSVALRFKPEDG